ncbi:MAG: hypothetical protein D6781_10590 [Verrucomicrobia bacterium]|nr:MAG: hypothetical protein D6781_10590 [Verrucomicrobiota bacterium]
MHYQHLADRVRGAREHQRRWRAWAAWHVVRLSRPDLDGDPRHEVAEPDVATITDGLSAHGLPGEVAWWQAACQEAAATLRTSAGGR